MKEWKCVLVGHHDNVGKVIDEWEAAGWRLHTYQTAGMGGAFNYTVNHYLLFVRASEQECAVGTKGSRNACACGLSTENELSER